MADRSRTFGVWERFWWVAPVISVIFWIAVASVVMAWRSIFALRPGPVTWHWLPWAPLGLLAGVVVARVLWRQEARRIPPASPLSASVYALLSITAAAATVWLFVSGCFWLGLGLCLWLAEETWALGLWRPTLPAATQSLSHRSQTHGFPSSASTQESEAALEPTRDPARPFDPESPSKRVASHRKILEKAADDAAETGSGKSAATAATAGVKVALGTAGAETAGAATVVEATDAAIVAGVAETEAGMVGAETAAAKTAAAAEEEEEQEESDSEDEVADEEGVEASDDAAAGLPPPDVSQQWTRQRLPGGGECLWVWHRLEFLPGQRHQTLHLPFCPAFPAPPAVQSQIVEGPGGQVKVSRVWGFGTRLEVRLATPSESAGEVLVLTLVQSQVEGP